MGFNSVEAAAPAAEGSDFRGLRGVETLKLNGCSGVPLTLNLSPKIQFNLVENIIVVECQKMGGRPEIHFCLTGRAPWQYRHCIGRNSFSVRRGTQRHRRRHHLISNQKRGGIIHSQGERNPIPRRWQIALNEIRLADR